MKSLSAVLLVSFFAATFSWAADQVVDSKWKRLYSDSAQSSSFLKSNWNKYEENYHPNYALDDDPNTAWVKGAPGDGVGEKLYWQVSPLKTADRILLRIRNGYQKSEKLFQANASVKSIEVSLLGNGKREVFRGEFPLKKEMGWQNIEIAVPNAAGFSQVELKVLSIYPGTVYKDLCISDVQTYVQSKVPYDEGSEKAKQTALKEWIRWRVNDAKYFAALPADYPFVASSLVQLEFKDGEDPGTSYSAALNKMTGSGSPSFSDQLKTKKPTATFVSMFSNEGISKVQSLLGVAKKIRAKKEWYRVSVSKKAMEVRKPDVAGDNAFHLKEVMKVLSRYSLPNELTYFSTDQAVGTKKLNANLDKGGTLEVVSNVKLEKNAAGAVQAVYYWQKSIGEDRGVWESQQEILVMYDTNRRIDNILIWDHGTSDANIDIGSSTARAQELATGPKEEDIIYPTQLQLVTPTYDANGKIEAVAYKSVFEDQEVTGNHYDSGRWGKDPAILSINP